MNILYIIILLIIFFGILTFIKNLPKNEEKEKVKENIGKYYYLKKSFFTYREKPFFDELIKQNNNYFVILSKVRMEDIVGVGKGIEKVKYKPMRNHIKSRHVDFAILNKEGQILAIIELDDKSHNSKRAINGDQIKNDIFNFVGIRFCRVKVGEIYSNKISEIFKELKRA